MRRILSALCSILNYFIAFLPAQSQTIAQPKITLDRAALFGVWLSQMNPIDSLKLYPAKADNSTVFVCSDLFLLRGGKDSD